MAVSDPSSPQSCLLSSSFARFLIRSLNTIVDSGESKI
ncbi:unnamed protein product [Rhodiola kirilowii]